MSHEIKIVVSGIFAPGKSALLNRYANDAFDESFQLEQDYIIKNIQIKGNDVVLKIWELPSAEVMSKITTSIYNNMHAMIILFSVTDDRSFSNSKGFIKERDRYNTKSKPVTVMVGNKIDAPGRLVDKNKAMKQAEEIDCEYRECSCKTGEGVNEVFDYLLSILSEAIPAKEEEKTTVCKCTIM